MKQSINVINVHCSKRQNVKISKCHLTLSKNVASKYQRESVINGQLLLIQSSLNFLIYY